jgi:aspartate aminotransferase-like enzyme
LPLSIFPKNSSNALTAVKCDKKVDASYIVQLMESKHHTYLAPSGGNLKNILFRVSHMGYQTEVDIELLVNNLKNTISEERKKGDLQ